VPFAAARLPLPACGERVGVRGTLICGASALIRFNHPGHASRPTPERSSPARHPCCARHRCSRIVARDSGAQRATGRGPHRSDLLHAARRQPRSLGAFRDRQNQRRRARSAPAERTCDRPHCERGCDTELLLSVGRIAAQAARPLGLRRIGSAHRSFILSRTLTQRVPERTRRVAGLSTR